MLKKVIKSFILILYINLFYGWCLNRIVYISAWIESHLLFTLSPSFIPVMHHALLPSWSNINHYHGSQLSPSPSWLYPSPPPSSVLYSTVHKSVCRISDFHWVILYLPNPSVVNRAHHGNRAHQNKWPEYTLYSIRNKYRAGDEKRRFSRIVITFFLDLFC